MSETPLSLERKCAQVSERLRQEITFLLVSLCAAFVAPLPGIARADDQVPAVDKPLRVTRHPSYCGVQSLYRALRSQGIGITFADLVRPEYISSTQGSTVADLKKAAQDFGAFVEPMSRMTCGMLRQVQFPVILHVKSDAASKDYNHWILFMGTEQGKAKIYDRDLPAAEIPFDELAALWDGTGLLVSDSPISRTGIWLGATAAFIFYVGLTAFAIGLLSLAERGFWRIGGKPAWRAGFCFGLGQAAGLLLIALGAAAGFRAASSTGFLSNHAMIAAIRDSHFGSFLPKIKIEEMARLIDRPDVWVVDARLADDFKAGHLKGAISIPVGSNSAQCFDAMATVPKESRIVVYSHSNGCPYGAQVAKELFSLGYHNILLFKGGWVEWQKDHSLRDKTEPLVKG